jgi:hypothetical protein
VDYDLNLALLEVDDATFWEGLQPLPIAARPVPSGRFEINRWRANGRFEQGTGEVVEFVVSASPFGVMEFPLLRGTTAMSGLGWSEVLTANGQVIGLLVSHSEQRIQAVNSDLINLLVRAAALEPYPGFAHRGFAWQRLNQPALRALLGLERQETGVLVRQLFPGGTGSHELRPRDILHRIDGYAIDPEGHIDHPTYGPLLFTMAINETLAPTVPVEIQRDGKRMRLELRRSRFSPDAYRIPPPVLDGPNDYEVFGGLVLQELHLGYLRAWGREWRNKAPTRLVIEYSLRALREQGEPPGKVLIVSRVLPDPANLGYEDVANGIVVGANGRSLASLADLREALRHPVRGYHLLRLLPGQGREQMVFPAGRLPEIDRRVAERYGIPARRP